MKTHRLPFWVTLTILLSVTLRAEPDFAPASLANYTLDGEILNRSNMPVRRGKFTVAYNGDEHLVLSREDGTSPRVSKYVYSKTGPAQGVVEETIEGQPGGIRVQLNFSGLAQGTGSGMFPDQRANQLFRFRLSSKIKIDSSTPATLASRVQAAGRAAKIPPPSITPSVPQPIANIPPSAATEVRFSNGYVVDFSHSPTVYAIDSNGEKHELEENGYYTLSDGRTICVNYGKNIPFTREN